MDKKSTIGVLGGGFKPPTIGHFELVKSALNKFSEIDEFIIFVGKKSRDGIGQVESLLVWEIYQNYLPMKVEIRPSTTSPIGEIYSYAKENQDKNIYWILGERDEADKEDNIKRSQNLDKKKDKYNNVFVKQISTSTTTSGTQAREALKFNSFNKFVEFIPSDLSEKDKKEVFNILRPSFSLQEDNKNSFDRVDFYKEYFRNLTPSEMKVDRKDDNIVISNIYIKRKPDLNEEASYSNHIDYKKYIKDLTKYMLNKGMNIVPLPKVRFIHSDSSNAKDFFGKTAYYDPNTKTIILYTEGRHPKDIVRSFSHEMVHHIQFLEGRLGNITTTNTHEDDELNKIEAEANLKGTMTFRNWTDSLNEAKPYKHKYGFDDKLGKDPFGLNSYARELALGLEEKLKNSLKSSNKVVQLDKEYNHTGKSSPYGSGYKELKEGKYDSFVNKLSKKAFSFFKKIYKQNNEKGDVTFSVGSKETSPDIIHDFFEFDFTIMLDITDDIYRVDGGSNSGIDDEGGEITPLLRINFQIPQNPDWQEVSFDLKDVIRHELEHLTQDGLNAKKGKPSNDDMSLRNMINLGLLSKDNYFKLEKEVDAMLYGLYLKAKKSKKPFLDVIDKYFNQQNLSKQERKEILRIWKDRAKNLSLPLKENQTTQYQIYSDMDGVITDFNSRFKKYSNGVPPSEYENTYGASNFWELISEQGVRFWIGMPWMEDGKQYWNYIKKYTPILLSSPSTENESRLGKRLWVKNNIPGTKLILARAKNKQNYSGENKILIDDKPSNIEEWKSQGGIGILHTSTSKTIQELKKLGL